MTHWMTCPTRRSTGRGMVRPIAFAVLRFTISSSFDGRSAGRSAGFALENLVHVDAVDAPSISSGRRTATGCSVSPRVFAATSAYFSMTVAEAFHQRMCRPDLARFPSDQDADPGHLRRRLCLDRNRRDEDRDGERQAEEHGHHSTTRSARASTDWGIAIPRARAVFRLIARSNFVGCSIGRSPGFAPFRILSTNPAARRNVSRRSTP